jgi:type II secretory pathway pseudopilin PulG
MKFGSTGIRALLRLLRRSRDRGRDGFTLLEALAALTLVLAFAAVLGPLLFHARRIVVNADGRVAAQILLRALLQEPLDRASLSSLLRQGQTDGLQWRIITEPSAIASSLPRSSQPQQKNKPLAEPAVQWVAYRVVANVSWAPGQAISAETVRLGRSE